MKKLFATAIILIGIMQISLEGSKEDWKKRTIYQILTDRFARTDGGTSACSDLRTYCGGTFVGIKNNLDYIQGMGFDAIWISPIIDNFENGYHGFHAKNWTEINSYFGTSQEFSDLVNECHKRDIWVMVDVVANHVGLCHLNYSRVYPFNDDSHYHSYCNIGDGDWTQNQWKVENCRLADLPDLQQENAFVSSFLLSWIKGLVTTYKIDGFRVDTTALVPKWFWDSFANSAGVFTMGEVYDRRLDYVFGYIGHLDTVLNYPLSWKIKYSFKGASFYDNIIDTINAEIAMIGDQMDYLGLFFDNHDQPRFLSDWSNDDNLLGAMAFLLFFKGIPIIYYGDEQQFTGPSDPYNREPLWTSMNSQSKNYLFLKAAINVRKQYHIWDYPYIQLWTADHGLAFTRGNLLVILTAGSFYQETDINNIPYPDGTVICNQLKQGDCVTVRGGSAHFAIGSDETKLYGRN